MTIFRTGKSGNTSNLCKVNKCPIESQTGLPIRLVHDSDYNGIAIVYIIESITNEFIIRKIVAEDLPKTVYLPTRIKIFATKQGEDAPELEDYNTEINFTGVESADIEISGEEPFEFTLANTVLS